MPAMPRIKGKPEKIAFSILGVPANLKSKKTERQKKIDEILRYQNTTLIR